MKKTAAGNASPALIQAARRSPSRAETTANQPSKPVVIHPVPAKIRSMICVLSMIALSSPADQIDCIGQIWPIPL